MFNKPSIHAKLEEEILSSLKELDNHPITSKEYDAIVDHISKLCKLKSEEGFKLPSMDTLAVVGANIFTIVWLTRYEREHVVSSKALGFVMKPR